MNTRLLSGFDHSEQDIRTAADIILSGGLVAFPTETVYGLGALASDANAVAAVFEVKGRPSDNPLIVHVANREQLATCGTVSEMCDAAVQTLMPGPLTIVIPASDWIPANVRAGLPSVAVRMPDHPIAQSLIEMTGPVVAPSANRSGRPSPTTAQHVMSDLGGLIPAILDGGPCEVGIESTVVDMTSGDPIVLRPGAIRTKQIEDACGQPVLGHGVVRADEGVSSRSPGTRHRHYSPDIPVRLVWNPDALPAVGEDTFLIVSDSMVELFPMETVHILSDRMFYADLRKAEDEGYSSILIVASRRDVSDALADRMERSAS